MRSLFSEIIVDNFAGGGGASTGIELATGRSVDIAINHDPAAIAMHKMNHPTTEHYCENVWDVDPEKACKGRKVALAWFSPDCKHFSKAKGGKPVEKSIRSLAWVAVRWARAVKPRVIMLENVEEFQTWGPLLKNNKPNPKRKGETFRYFVKALEECGYEVDWRELRACDYGAPTIRKRFFLIARCDGEPIKWPQATHGAPDSREVKEGHLKPWRTAAEIIDWNIECKSIFERKKPLCENTMRRIARGLKRFVLDNPQPFILQIGQQKFGGDRRVQSIHQPLATIVTKAESCLVAPTLIQYHKEQSEKEVRGQSIKKPLMTMDTSNRYGLVSAFITKYFAGGYTGAGAEVKEPLPTITAIDHNAIVMPYIMQMYGTSTGAPVTKPLATITAQGQHIAEVEAFLVKYYGHDDAQSILEPLHTVTARDRFGLVVIEEQEYRIVDIGMRMLAPRELFNAQGFPKDYIIEKDADGKHYPKSAQVARCGNAVPPPFAEALTRANLPEICGERKAS